MSERNPEIYKKFAREVCERYHRKVRHGAWTWEEAVRHAKRNRGWSLDESEVQHVLACLFGSMPAPDAPPVIKLFETFSMD